MPPIPGASRQIGQPALAQLPLDRDGRDSRSPRVDPDACALPEPGWPGQ